MKKSELRQLIREEIKKSFLKEAEFKNINRDENRIKLAIKDVEKKFRLKANRDNPPQYAQLSLNKIMLSKVLGREDLGKEHQGAWEKLKKEYKLSESVNEGKLQDLVGEFQSSTDPDNEYHDYEGRDSEEILRDIRNEFGDKIADQVSDGEYKMHYPRGGWKSMGSDKLSDKERFGYHSPRTTKGGKMHKQDVNRMKNYYKR